VEEDEDEEDWSNEAPTELLAKDEVELSWLIESGVN
jgi:hypothetical protein